MHVLKQTYNIYCGKSHLLHVEYEHNLYTRKEKKNQQQKTLSRRSIYSPSRELNSGPEDVSLLLTY